MAAIDTFLGANPYFSAGFGLMTVGAGFAILRNLSGHSAVYLRRRFLVTVEIPNRDPSYAWFLKWASTQQQQNNTTSAKPSILASLLKSNLLQVETHFTRPSTSLTSATATSQSASTSSVAQFALVPAPGRHFFKHGPAWFMLDRTREKSMLDLRNGTPFETVTITTLARDQPYLVEILNEAKRAALSEEEDKTVVYTSYGPEWRPFGAPRRKRPLESVVLDIGVKERIVKDVTAFLENSAWYHERGIPYRRGYLLHGPPGSGKTSFITSLASTLSYNICILNLSERNMTDDRLAHLLTNTPPASLILLEDVDAAFHTETRQGKEGFTSLVTFSGLLNALDGVAASEERIVFMTTNHLERLDAALIRPGRADVKVFVGNATDHQIKTMFELFYEKSLSGPESDTNSSNLATVATKFLTAVRDLKGGDTVSPAALQGHFVLFRDSPEAAILNVHLLREE